MLVSTLVCLLLHGARGGWVARAGGTLDDSARAISVDSNGDTFLAGTFRGSVAFGATRLSSGAGEHDDAAFVAKVDGLTGDFVWAVQIVQAVGPSTSSTWAAYAIPAALAVDGAGDVVIAGSFRATIALGSRQLSSAFSQTSSRRPSDVFVAKLDGATGAFQWAVRAGSQSGDEASAVALDSSGDAYVAGYHSGEEGGVASFGSIPLGNGGHGDDFGFVAKLNGLTGAFEWAAQVGGSIQSIAVHGPAEGIFLAGHFSHAGNGFTYSGTFGSLQLIAAGAQADSDAFVARMNGTTREFDWAVRAGGPAADRASAIAVDASGSVYVSGRFVGTATFGARSLTSDGYDDVFVAKLDGLAGSFTWAVNAGGASGAEAKAIAADPMGARVAISGVIGYDGSASFGSTILASQGYDAFVAMLDGVSGAFLWATRAGGSDADDSRAVAIDASGDVLAAGSFLGQADVGASAGGSDAYVMKLDGGTGAFARAPTGGGLPNSLSTYTLISIGGGGAAIVGIVVAMLVLRSRRKAQPKLPPAGRESAC